MKIAIIDLGTNTFHLLVIEAGQNGGWRKLLHNRITVKLGQKGIDKNVIANAPFNRGINALEKFAASIKFHKIKRVYAFGTAALRSASNGADFLNLTRSRFGIDVKIISGKQEAELIYLGVQQAVKLGKEKSLIMDIGGGSVEFIIADNKKAYWKGSYKLGAALLIEKFKPLDPVSVGQIKQISKFFDTELKSLFVACEKYKPIQLIGSAGSFETFSSMIRHRFPKAGSHYGKTEHPISLNHFNKLYEELIKSTVEERKHMRGLIKMRVDMIVMAGLLLNYVLQKIKIDRMIMSAYSLKEGAVYSVLNDIES